MKATHIQAKVKVSFNLVFTSNTFFLWDGEQSHEFPKQLLNFSSLAEVISFETILEIFSADEIGHLLNFLPALVFWYFNKVEWGG